MRILFIAPLRYVATMNFVCESITAFARYGHTVDVLVSEACDPPFDISGDNINVLNYKDSPQSLFRVFYIGLFQEALRCARNARYDLVIGLSQLGLIISRWLNKRFKTPYIFFNDELWFGNEHGTVFGNIYGSFMKALERRANKNVLLTVTQDPMRGRFLSVINRIPVNSLRYLPNSPAGRAEWKPSTYLHDKLGIPRSSRIVLWPGSVQKGDGSIDLARSAKCWPSYITLVFHCPNGNYNNLVKEIHRQNPRARISTDPLRRCELDYLIRSASIGIAFYRDAGINARYICHSSGKINYMLFAGIPCIVNDFEGLRWVHDVNAGRVICHPDETLRNVRHILKHESEMRQNALAVFEERLSFDKHFERFSIDLQYMLTHF